MKFGVTCFLTEDTISPVELGVLAEERGFESLLLPEHTHIPSCRKSPFPGGELPDYYSRIWDPFVALAAVAMRTERLTLGTAVSLVAQRDPIVLAKELATLDHLCGGRLVLGVGAGWNLEEAANHRIDPAQRFEVMRERVLAMRAIWTEEEASFEGEHVSFEKIWCRPKPVRSTVPVLVGGNGPTVIDRVLEYGDGWLPMCLWDLDEMIGRIEELGRRAAAAGREVQVSAYMPPAEPKAMERLAAAGAERSIFLLPTAGRPEVESALDDLVAVRDAYERAGA